MLAKAGPNADSIALGNPICLYNLLLNIKNDSVVAMLSKSRKISLVILGGILIIVILTINTNINGVIQWNVSK